MPLPAPRPASDPAGVGRFPRARRALAVLGGSPANKLSAAGELFVLLRGAFHSPSFGCGERSASLF
ncbi:hypothetical protein JCM17823_24570 [Halorubrum gandharaense]